MIKKIVSEPQTKKIKTLKVILLFPIIILSLLTGLFIYVSLPSSPVIFSFFLTNLIFLYWFYAPSGEKNIFLLKIFTLLFLFINSSIIIISTFILVKKPDFLGLDTVPIDKKIIFILFLLFIETIFFIRLKKFSKETYQTTNKFKFISVSLTLCLLIYFISCSSYYISTIMLNRAALYGNNEAVKTLLKLGANPKKEFLLSNPIHNAIFMGHLDTLKIFKKNGINFKDKRPKNNYLQTAIAYSMPHITKYFLENDLSVDSLDSSKENLLTTAVILSKQNTKVVEVLLKHNTNINHKNISGTTALMQSSKKGNLDMVKLIVNYGANVNLTDNLGLSALGYARNISDKTKKDNIIKFLKSKDAIETFKDAIVLENIKILKNHLNEDKDPNGFFNKDDSLLIFVAKENLFETCKALIESGADINQKSIHGQTSLMIAAGSGNTDMISFLIKNGANTTIKDKRKNLSLNIAAKGGHKKAFEILIKAGKSQNNITLLDAASVGQTNLVRDLIAEVKEKNSEYILNLNKALILASAYGHTDTMLFLIKSGADFNFILYRDIIAGEVYESAIHAAASTGEIKSLKLLIKKGAEVNLKTPDAKEYFHNVTPLMNAAYAGKFKAVKLLIENGASVNEKNSLGESALLKAIENNYIEIIRYLLKNGADPNMDIRNGSNLLFETVLMGNDKAVELLVKFGVKTDKKTFGSTVIEFAKRSKKEKIAKILQFSIN